MKLLGDHLAPQPSVIAERVKFYKRSQHDSEPIAVFVAELRGLAQHCDFGSFLDQAVRDHFVCGLRPEDIQSVLSTEDKKLTFQKAVEKALGMDTATKSAALTHMSELQVPDVCKVGSQKKPSTKEAVDKTGPSTSSNCFRCRSPNHSSGACPHISDTCFKCNRKGHIQRAFRTGDQKSTHVKSRRRIKALKSDHETLLRVRAVNSVHLEPITVPMSADGVTLAMELDTGAAVSVVSLKEFQRLFSDESLLPVSLKLRTYTGAKGSGQSPCAA